jgi:hypothetical protein
LQLLESELFEQQTIQETCILILKISVLHVIDGIDEVVDIMKDINLIER